MPKFSRKSIERLESCHVDLQYVFFEVIKHRDITILCGHRDRIDQERAFKAGNSGLTWPHSLHNKKPSRAVDVAPYPVDWDDLNAFRELGGFVLGVASQLGVELVWGGHWRRLRDYPHFQISKKA